MTLTIASLCSGYGGLDMAAQSVLGGTLAFVADPDPGATRILAHHHPDVPNLGDITAVDWGQVPAVDVLTAGFPCQDISYAGRGAGIKEGTRSGLWSTVVDAARVLRPRIVFVENVSGIVARRPGLDVVLADLARLGFDAEWRCVRASDVGAPHPRNRWFLLAWPASEDPHVAVGGERRVAAPGQAEGGRARANFGGRGGAPAAHADGAPGRFHEPGGGPSPLQGPEIAGRAPIESGRCARGDRGAISVAWGAFAPAISRWEHVTGHAAPVPTEPGRNGQPRLSPRFVEWMQGLPEGHVTDVPGLTRTQQLHALGNGVVPQQGELALRMLLEASSVNAD